ncbi:uncharacterized protein METZ01_LOCUS165582, partial [marine metagenome]
NIESGNANVLIGNNAGDGLLPNADNKLIIDNGNSNLGVTNPLISGSFAVADRGVTVDGTLLSRDDLSTANDINIAQVTQDNSVVADLFTIAENSGDINMTNYSSGQKINFVVDENTTVLTLDGTDNMVKLPLEKKLASDDDTDTYINAVGSGARLNVKGADKVLVHAQDPALGVIQLLAADSIRMTSDNIEINSTQEFIVSNDMRVGRDFRVGDVTNTEFKISHSGAYNTIIENKITDKDLIFKVAPSGAGTEIMRIDGDGQSMLMADLKRLEFRDTETYMHSTEANILALVAPSLNITSTSGVTLDTDNHFQFRDAATYVASSASNVLDIVSPRLVLSQSSTAAGRVDIGTGEANKIESDATSMTLTSPNLTLNGTTKTIAVGEVEFQDSLIFANNGSEVNELVIAETGTDDYTITNMVQDKDIIFNLKPGGTPTEIARFDGSATSFRMAATNKLEFTDGDDYINNEDSKLNIVSKNSGNVKIGNIGADAANTTNRVEIHALNTIEPNTDEILVTAPDETPKVTLSSVKDDITLMPQLHFKKIRGGATGINNDLLGEIAAIGEDGVNTVTTYAKIQFKSTDVTDAAERGSMQFITKGATGPFDDSEQGVEDLLMDINHSTENAVTVHADLFVEGAMSLNGAAFKDDITSKEKGENSLGTDGEGEWKSLNLYDADGVGSMITFGIGSDDATDLRLTYNGTDGLTLNR